MDETGAVVPNAGLTLRAVGTGVVREGISGPEGLFRFPNLIIGVYNLTVAAKGFRDFEQKGISVDINQTVTVNVRLELGAATQTIEVTANASPLNYENGEMKSTIAPNVVEELPLLVSSAQRSVGSFVILMPGVTTGTGNNPYDARINGGLQSGDEALLDGVSMFEGLEGNGGMISIFTDYPISPDTVDELSVITSNYEPQYGNTTSAIITAVTKSGTSRISRNRFRNASQHRPQCPHLWRPHQAHGPRKRLWLHDWRAHKVAQVAPLKPQGLFLFCPRRLLASRRFDKPRTKCPVNAREAGRFQRLEGQCRESDPDLRSGNHHRQSQLQSEFSYGTNQYALPPVPIHGL